MKIAFVSSLDARQILKFLFLEKEYDEVYYFDISRAGKILLARFRPDHRLRRFNFILGELRDENGGCLFERIYGEDLNEVYREIREEICPRNSFITGYKKRFDTELIESFFMKYFGREIKDIVVFINVIDWYRNQKNEDLSAPIEFLIEQKPFLSVLKRFAKKKYGLELKPRLSLRSISASLFKIFGNVFLSAMCAIKPILRPKFKPTRVARGEEALPTPLIAIHYSLLGMTFDVIQRSDFFWMLFSDIPFNRCLVYFDRKDKPVTEDRKSVV